MQMHCPVQFARAVTLQLLDTVLELAGDRNVEYLFYFSTQDLRTTQSWSVWSDTYLATLWPGHMWIIITFRNLISRIYKSF